MIPINTIKNGEVVDVKTGELYDNILEICKEHKGQNKALAFAFILYNHENPQINKILNDKDYWRALDRLSGRFLSIFYISQQDSYFGQDLKANDGKERRGLYELDAHEQLIPILKPYFELDESLKLPAVLFFQEEDGLITDYFLLGLDEHRMEDSFWELQDYIKGAVYKLGKVTIDNLRNSKEIFNLLKSRVQGENLNRRVFLLAQKFPVRLLVSWIIGKV